jgi:Tol biopolymer transport system component
MENYAEQKAYEWSPDGTKIAFFLKIGDEEPEVYQLAIIELITNKIINYCIEGMYVRWSPDGQYLLLTQDFYSGSRTHDAYLIRLEDGAAWKISEYFYVNGWMVEPEGNTPTP